MLFATIVFADKEENQKNLFDAVYVGSLHTINYEGGDLTNFSGYRLGVLKWFDLPLGRIQATCQII